MSNEQRNPVKTNLTDRQAPAKIRNWAYFFSDTNYLPFLTPGFPIANIVALHPRSCPAR